MKVEVLIATMNRHNYEFLDNMNLKTGAVIGNQNGSSEQIKLNKSFGDICVICSDKKGVSYNRNLTLENSQADICILGDDDVRYVNDYDEIVANEFENHPTADVIIFNLYEKPIRRYVIKKEFKVNKLNYLRFGAVRIAFRRKSIVDKVIRFDNSYGPGADVPMGEDNIFLHDCLEKKLNIIAVPKYLLHLTDERESTWFNGFNDKYFANKGLLFKRLYPKFWRLICLQDAIRHRKKYSAVGGWYFAYKKMTNK